jgi:hypothetical protein
MASLSLCRLGTLALAALGLALAQHEPSCEAGATDAETLSLLTAVAADALRRSPTSAPHHSALARLLARSNRTDEAAEHFQTAAELPPASLVRIAAARPYSQSVYSGTALPPIHEDIPVGGNGGWSTPRAFSPAASADSLPLPSAAAACPDIDARAQLSPELFLSQYVIPGKPVLLPLGLFRPAGASPFDDWAREALLQRVGKRRTGVIGASSGVTQAAYARAVVGAGSGAGGGEHSRGEGGGAGVAVGSESSAGTVPMTLEQFVMAAERAEAEGEEGAEARAEPEV